MLIRLTRWIVGLSPVISFMEQTVPGDAVQFTGATKMKLSCLEIG